MDAPHFRHVVDIPKEAIQPHLERLYALFDQEYERSINFIGTGDDEIDSEPQEEIQTEVKAILAQIQKALDSVGEEMEGIWTMTCAYETNKKQPPQDWHTDDESESGPDQIWAMVHLELEEVANTEFMNEEGTVTPYTSGQIFEFSLRYARHRRGREIFKEGWRSTWRFPIQKKRR